LNMADELEPNNIETLSLRADIKRSTNDFVGALQVIK